MKPSAALLVLFLAAPVFPATQETPAPPREVGVLVLADEEVRSIADWQPRIAGAMDVVSGEFERLFGIRLAVRRFGEWRSDDGVRSLDLLLEKVDAETGRAGCDAVLALTAQRDLEGTLVGFSMYKEGTILVRLEDGSPGLERVLEHEWGHMFGAAHIADRGSIMDSLLQGGEFGALNARAIRLHRDRSFNGIDFPLRAGPWPKRPRSTPRSAPSTPGRRPSTGAASCPRRPPACLSATGSWTSSTNPAARTCLPSTTPTSCWPRSSSRGKSWGRPWRPAATL